MISFAELCILVGPVANHANRMVSLGYKQLEMFIAFFNRFSLDA